MSEFYKIRRSSITDITGLIAFVIGWFASGVIGWPYIKAGFDAGDPTPGVIRFVVVIFAGAIGCGLAGMALGFVGGRIWETIHTRRRAHEAPRPDVPEGMAFASHAATASKPRVRQALPPLRYETSNIPYPAYLALAKRIDSAEYDAKRAAAALERSINIGAWDGDRLVGVARLVTDGYFFAALADLLVDPDLQHRGLGRELINRAFEKTPRGSLFVGSPLASSAFFDRIGCDRGPTGFTMRRFAKRGSGA